MTTIEHGFSYDSREVWCTFREADALTRIYDGIHFCQYCAATDHEELAPASHVSETPSSVA